MDELTEKLTMIDEGLLSLHRMMFQHKTWELLQRKANISLDRASAALLRVVASSPNKAVRAQDVAHKLGIEAPSVTRKIQQLEAEGLLTRTPDKKDRRATNLHITPEGRAALQRLQAARHEIISRSVEGWSPQELEPLALGMSRLSKQLTEAINKEV